MRMKRSEAIKLLNEALSRIERPTPNANGGEEQVGGAYWRLSQVLEYYLAPILEEQEGEKHAKFMRETHGVICRNEHSSEIENRQKGEKWISADLVRLLRKHREGTGVNELAIETGVSKSQVRTLLSAAERIEKKNDSTNPFDRLSVRVKNCLLAEGLKTVEAVRETAANPNRLLRIPGIGRLALKEVLLWLNDETDDITTSRSTMGR